MSTNMHNRCTLYFDLKQELECYAERGIRISVEGRTVLPRRAAQLCCFEANAEYMRDYIINEQGKVIEIGFNKIRTY